MNDPRWTTRLSDEEFFALPEENLAGGFGMAILRVEGAPLYRDADGCYWQQHVGSDDKLYRAPFA